MSLKNSELQYYDSNVLRLPSEKRKEYHTQVDNLITELSKNICSNSDLKIAKVVKAGSFAKYTILKKTIDDYDQIIKTKNSGESSNNKQFNQKLEYIVDKIVEK